MREPEYHELSKYYDLINQKYVPYEKHFTFIEGALGKYGKKPHRILDLACGTGTHSVYFARNGYEVVGVDLSHDMLEIAREKARSAVVQIKFLQGDMRDLHFDKEFDCSLCINQSAMYCLTYSDISALLVGVKNSLKEGGVFIMDFLSKYDEGEFTGKEWVESEGVRVECIREETYDKANQILTDKTTYFVTEDNLTRRFEGYSQTRIFYPQEMLSYLKGIGGFKILGLHECWSLEEEPVGPYFAVVAERA